MPRRPFARPKFPILRPFSAFNATVAAEVSSYETVRTRCDEGRSRTITHLCTNGFNLTVECDGLHSGVSTSYCPLAYEEPQCGLILYPNVDALVACIVEGGSDGGGAVNCSCPFNQTSTVTMSLDVLLYKQTNYHPLQNQSYFLEREEGVSAFLLTASFSKAAIALAFIVIVSASTVFTITRGRSMKAKKSEGENKSKSRKRSQVMDAEEDSKRDIAAEEGDTSFPSTLPSSPQKQEQKNVIEMESDLPLHLLTEPRDSLWQLVAKYHALSTVISGIRGSRGSAARESYGQGRGEDGGDVTTLSCIRTMQTILVCVFALFVQTLYYDAARNDFKACDAKHADAINASCMFLGLCP